MSTQELNEELGLENPEIIQRQFVEFTSLLLETVWSKRKDLLYFMEKENYMIEDLIFELNELMEWYHKIFCSKEWVVNKVSFIVDWEDANYYSGVDYDSNWNITSKGTILIWDDDKKWWWVNELRKLISKKKKGIKENKERLSIDRKSTRLNSSHVALSRMPSSAWKTKTTETT